ncbi:MAG: hypothetical protein RLZZ387_825 [Chloroflexota bacterium]
MDERRLTELLGRTGAARILVVGDFFLDRYLLIDPALAEISVETGLEARQVTDVVAAPGAAGTVTANLRALGAQVTALGVVGDDGEGYELRRGLRAAGVDDGALVVAAGRRTPTYTKPMVREPGAAPRELERLDIRTRAPMPAEAVDAVLVRLRALAAGADAVVIADQMPEAEHGVITSRVREAIAALARERPGVPFLADSRARIGLFRGIIAKPNMRECVAAVFPGQEERADQTLAREAGEELRRRTGCPVLVTLSGDGMLVVEEGSAALVPALPVRVPIDVVGAGDSVMAAVAAGLCAGATLGEAAQIGMLAASVTISQLGTTGTASPGQILDRWRSEQRYG